MNTQTVEKCRAVVKPRNEAEIIDAIKQARSLGCKVRARGSGGSRNHGGQTSGICIDLCNYVNLVSRHGNRVTVQAGMLLHTLNPILWEQGLSLPTLCEWDYATVGGAISTGSHGGSMFHGTLASSVSGIRIIDGRGEILELDEGDELFKFFVISFGRLGVVSEVTFKCEESFYIEMHEFNTPFDQLIRHYDQNCSSNEFYSAVWMPATGQAIHYTGNRVSQTTGKSPNRTARFNLKDIASEVVSSALKRSVLLSGKQRNKLAADRSYAILAPLHNRPGFVKLVRTLGGYPLEMEFAIPYEVSGEALRELSNLLRPQTLAFPIGIRPGAQEPFAISPCYERPATWISVFLLYNQKADFFVMPILDLFRRYSARPHWGKCWKFPPAYLETQYPLWQDFKELVSRHDPDQIFANGYSNCMGL